MSRPEPETPATGTVDVSRETAVRAALGRVYPDAMPGLDRYAELLADAGVTRGLLGPRELPRLWSRHLANCAVVAELVPAGAGVADLGSGAGLPGLPLALVRADITVVLVEPLLRRATFLAEVVDDLGLAERVEVRRTRAEDAVDVAADVVTARAVAALDRLAGWALPLARAGGQLLALKGESAATELAAARDRLAALGGDAGTVLTCGDGIVHPPTVVVRVRRVGAGPTRSAGGRGSTAR